MKIVLHVGAHQTATTTLQRMMGGSRLALEAAKIGYWGPKRTRGGLFQGLIGHSGAVHPWHVSRARKRVRLGLATLADRGVDRLLVSEENMLGTMRSVLDDRILFGDAALRVHRFAQAFDGHDLTIALGIRSYAAWWRSVLAFRLTRGGPRPSRPLAAKLVAQPRRWRHVVADLAVAVPHARIVVWDHAGMGRRPDALVRSLLDVDLPFSGAAERLNTGASLDALRAYVDACGYNPEVIPSDAGDFMPFDADQRAVLGDLYCDDIDWLAAGADGLATFLAEPGHQTPRQTGHGRGQPNDGPHRRLADTG